MTDPVFLTTLTALTTFVVQNAPGWLASLSGTFLEKSVDVAFEKGGEFALERGNRLRHRLFHLDEKEQRRHLELALKNAIERGLVAYKTPHERDLYGEIMRTLSQPGASGEALRRAMVQIFTLSDEPDRSGLADAYNTQQRRINPAHQEIDAAPYLSSFFSALIGELYADPYFRPQLSDVLQLRAAKGMQLSLLEIVRTLQKIGEMLAENYSADAFAQDISTYIEHIERTLHHLKIIGIVPKDQNVDPELSGIFVPLRIAFREQASFVTSLEQTQRAGLRQELLPPIPNEAANTDAHQNSLVGTLERSRFLVLLGGPGSGKSTATKHLAWSHVAAIQPSPPPVQAQILLLSGNPVPLRIELRLLSEERKRTNYDFLSFATEVLLKREGVAIKQQMFKELLTRRGMVLLFDGLDEVTTLEERLELVNEIEHFALCYPGNCILVTSRPVGYELARFSHPLFSHAEVLPFDETQIRQYLANWYTSVLRLSPIPQREQEEMNLLLNTLKENPRLHKLAENPLLLTVITALHRYERLPDRRVQVYDRCADLLLETWAKLKGTDKRWQDMRMIKDEQYACVAYLGFVLHERSQGENEDATVDVTARFLRKEVEKFLRQRKLISEGAERQAEAKHFIDLAQQEAGLIVERGTDENGEKLYSFVHRTFQEYFAAADIYERYQQAEDPKIIGKFLREHLHDPHWHEVIMLLLGKMKSTPVTNQLRQILQGKLKSLRSCYTQIVQQDLFFVCDCLVEEIKVEKTLVEMVASRLKNVVQSSWSPAQQREALNYLGKLMQTHQYGEQGRQALLLLIAKNSPLDEAGRLAAIQAFYLHSSNSEDLHLAIHHLTDQNLSVEQIRETAESLYHSSPEDSEARLLAIRLLSDLLQRPDLSVEQIRKTAESLYYSSPQDSEAQQLAIRLLSDLLQHPDLSVEQIRETAMSLYHSDIYNFEDEQLVTRLLSDLLQRPGLSVEQARETAKSLYRSSPEDSEARLLATDRLLQCLSSSTQMENGSDVYSILREMLPQFHRLHDQI